MINMYYNVLVCVKLNTKQILDFVMMMKMRML